VPAHPDDRTRASERRLRVVHAPYIGQNAYQPRLLEELGRVGIDAIGAKRTAHPFVRQLFSWRCDVLHLHWTQLRWLGPRLLRTAAIASYFAQLRALQRGGTRIVWTIHNLVPHECDDPGAELVFLARLAETVDACIVHSESARDEVVASVASLGGSASAIAAKLRVVPHGNYIGCYRPARTREAERARLGIADDETVFAFVGQVRDYKNVDGLARAFRTADLPRARLLIRGRPRGDAVDRAVRDACADDPRIDYRAEFLADDELAATLLASDAVALPYHDCLTSGAALLAMSFGKAIVAPDRGCFRELVGAGAVGLYRGDAPGGIAHALRALATDPAARAASGARNLEIAKAADWSAIAAMTAELYRSLPGVRSR
jgi:glycosyltransferase involved in cell wall biosynthesis